MPPGEDLETDPQFEDLDATVEAAPLDLDATVGAEGPYADPSPSSPLTAGRPIGRYVVLDKLGEGGMGVVYAAYDPELDRKVAIKLLSPALGHAGESQGRGRLLREAQALARLAHPNIVAVHDVGTIGEQIWIAMEFVAGGTLGAWIAAGPRTWPEVLGVMIPAGRGLAAAHAAGLLHRDFKPDNVMVGSDGRVRVMDLGLARALDDDDNKTETETETELESTETNSRDAFALELTNAGAMLGTPAYMAPEQFRRAKVGTAADQFAFCVSLWEALYGERPFQGKTLIALATAVTLGKLRPPPSGRKVPAWLRRICLRGLSTDPSQRFTSIQELLTELGKGQTRVRRRRVSIALASLVVLAGSAELIRRAGIARQRAECVAAGASIDEVWDPTIRGQVERGLLDAGPSYAKTSAAHVLPYLDAYADEWRTRRRDLCLAAHVDGQASPAELERGEWCLDERRMDFEALTGTLINADATVLAQAVSAAAGLAPLSSCSDADLLARLPSPPSDRASVEEVQRRLSSFAALEAAGKVDDALLASRGALEAAEPLAWPPIQARVRLALGRAQADVGALSEAKPEIEAAYFEAANAGAHDVAAAAATELVEVAARLASFDAAALWTRHAEVALTALGEPADGLGRVRLRLHRAHLDHLRGEFAKAIAEYEALIPTLETQLGPEHPQVAGVLVLLANSYSEIREFKQAMVLLDRALAIQIPSFGPDHPSIARTLSEQARAQSRAGNFEASRALDEQALAIRERALGPEHPDVAASLAALAGVSWRLGEFERGFELQARAIVIQEAAFGPDHPNVANSLEDLALIHSGRGEHREELALLERALAIRERSLGENHVDSIMTLDNIGVAHGALGNRVEALEFHERALALHLANSGPDHVNTAGTMLNVAAALDDPARKVELYERALAILEAKLGPEHFNVGIVLNNLAAGHLDKGEVALAKSMFERSLAIFVATLGEDHPVVMHPVLGLARVAYANAEFTEALELGERGLSLAPEDDVTAQAEASFMVAQALAAVPVAKGRDLVRARTLALSARPAFAVISDVWTVDDVDAWLRRHGGPARASELALVATP